MSNWKITILWLASVVLVFLVKDCVDTSLQGIVRVGVKREVSRVIREPESDKTKRFPERVHQGNEAGSCYQDGNCLP